MEHRTPPGTDTLEQIRLVRERYGYIASRIYVWKQSGRHNPEQLPEFVARATIAMREVDELVDQTHTLPVGTMLVDLLRGYTDLVVMKVEKGL